MTTQLSGIHRTTLGHIQTWYCGLHNATEGIWILKYTACVLKNFFEKIFNQNLVIAIPCIMCMNIQHNLVSHGCSPEAMWGSWPLHIHNWASLYWIPAILKPMNHPPGMIDNGLTNQFLFTCNCSGTMAVPLTGTASPTLPTKSQPTAQNNTSDETFYMRLSLGEGTLRQFFKSQWPDSHRGHCDLDHQSANYPDPTCLTPQNPVALTD